MTDVADVLTALDGAEVLSSAGEPVTADAGTLLGRRSLSPAPTLSAPAALPDGPIRDGSGGGFGFSGGAGGDIDIECAGFPTTDLGNARRVLARHGHDFLFVREWGWLSWDGRRWKRDGAEDRLEAAIKATIWAIGDEVAALKGTAADRVIAKRRKEEVRASAILAEWAEKSQAAGHVNCLVGLVQSDLARSPSDFDADPMRINVSNGTLVVSRPSDPDEPYVRLVPHDRKDLMTRIADVVYDPTARCPLFDRFLDEVQPPSTEGGRRVQRFLDQWAGISLTGDASEQKLVFMFGKGRNGKSVWMDTIAHVCGDYADTVPIETFLDQGRARAAGAPTPELAMLNGVRCLRTSEPKRGASLDEALIKLATGGEPMKVRELNKGYFTLIVQFSLTIQGNYRPKIDGTDEGIWARLRLIPWPVFIPKDRRDLKLTAKLKQEASGILNRMLAGLFDWLDNGLVEPPEITDATEAFRNDSDPLGRFLGECTRSTIGRRVAAFELWELFNAWGKAEGIEWTMKGLSNAMVDKGFAKKKASEIFWLDLETTKTVSDFIDPTGRPLHGG